ncbi:MAG TPA: ice-binding family protein, partial [Longimicrobium sp.]|uniref:ice-binding family protein n=1 Tax=Longimicrobium sp. TaxID=2029185 RepID=UPI002EDADA5F
QRHAGDTYAQDAQTDLTIAYNALAAMPCTATITSDLGGTTLTPGVYCAPTSVGVTGTVTLSGPADAVFVIKAGSSLTTAGSVVMQGGAQARNVYWLVGSSATLGTGSAWQGNIIAFTSITLVDNVSILGRALARNGAVTLGTGSVITLP